MLILAADQSTANGSLALLRNGETLAVRNWEENGRDNRQFFVLLNRLFKEQNISPAEIDLYAVGLGPGTFAGLRISLSTIRAMALPGGKPVMGISSGEIIAVEVFNKTGRNSITVVGDARRGHIWHAQFMVTASGSQLTAGYTMVAHASLSSALTAGSAVATADWARLGGELEKIERPGIELIRERIVPTALTAGTIAGRRYSAVPAPGTARNAADILAPLYMNPPVSVAPRFT